ncbi:hypothetical protein PJ985_02160 [Streptomyces sp. ACA25]|uniref:hypothetical protein n=1 Tax=Streptomyces sp. ACA25 TaxID=3022596 RepID=UPI002307E82E|nr:hypothetical protein [Streptomyces sp. ACA25]MDB1086378.1 hypothetical protein [Streptomyces sp. ACA25]
MAGRKAEGNDEQAAVRHRGRQGEHTGAGADGDRRPGPPDDGDGFPHPEGGRYSAHHEQVFRALAEAESAHGGEPVHLEEVARNARLSPEETRAMLHDLVTVHRLATELQGIDSPDLGPRFGIRARL